MRQHKEDCQICKDHHLFDLDEKIMVHGTYYTKEELLNALNIKKRLQVYVEYLYELLEKGLLTSQGSGILITLGNCVKNGEIELSPPPLKERLENASK